MSESHPNNNPLQSVIIPQPIPQSVLYPLLKSHVVTIDGLTAGKTEVVGFKVVSGGAVDVHCEINGRPYTGEMGADSVRSCLENELQTRLRIERVEVLRWRLKDKDNPYLVVDYTIVLPSEVDNE